MFRKVRVLPLALSGILVVASSGSLPMLAASSAQAEGKTTELSGSVTKSDFGEGLPKEIENLTEESLKNDDNAKEVARLVKKFRSRPHKVKVTAKEALYAMVPYRGFGPSKEGANIILENISKIKTLAAAEYIQQRIEDSTHTKVVQATLQIAMGLDCSDAGERQRMVDEGLSRLKDMVGEEKAKQTLTALTAWSKDLDIPAIAYQKPLWDVDKFQENLHECTQTSVHVDPSLHNTIKKLKKYNRSKGAVAASGALEATLTVAALMSPGMFAPVGFELVNAGFIAGTGGSEPTKLVNEVYFAKAIESRWKRLNEESQMALQGYQNAVRTKSPTLMAASEAVLQSLVGSERVSKVLGQSVLANTNLPKELPIQTAETAVK